MKKGTLLKKSPFFVFEVNLILFILPFLPLFQVPAPVDVP